MGCTAIVSQIPPSDLNALDTLESREDRERAYEQNRIVVKERLNGTRYTKGDQVNTPESDWQSLDLMLRSDPNAARALPDKTRTKAQVMVGMASVGGLATVAGIAGTAGQGLDTTRLTGSGVLLIGGAVTTVAFTIAAGVLYGKMRKDYRRAVDVYNASLSMRLGLSEGDGTYRPPGNVLVDPDGFIVLSPSGSYVENSALDQYNEALRRKLNKGSAKLAPDPAADAAVEGANPDAPEEGSVGANSPEEGSSTVEGSEEAAEAASPASQSTPATEGAASPAAATPGPGTREAGDAAAADAAAERSDPPAGE